ncbi:uncharacterized protein BX663DRAFT_502977 [Cokeromyces recurvatus]|uniref:uncharacterized protein n=1 Tax=Cokeromyces recurvatus TaxID=90255 RepID=UPI00221FB7CD|nr:uncharacterized protein BX663DRAFT_502977 [Cokeromyces recurvatus]KAI7904615.1 hypothetical protein BX663DRAFT_502977 [Cokeromyces recurvatus]
MKFIFILLLFLLSTTANVIPNEDDFQAAKLFIQQLNVHNDIKTIADNQGEIVYPLPNTTWHVGELVNVTFETKQPQQVVSIFFFGDNHILAGGPLSKTVFPFTVPSEAVSGAAQNETSLLLAVRRLNSYLQTVDSVVVRVLPPQ